jgi:hypothetical protein
VEELFPRAAYNYFDGVWGWVLMLKWVLETICTWPCLSSFQPAKAVNFLLGCETRAHTKDGCFCGRADRYIRLQLFYDRADYTTQVLTLRNFRRSSIFRKLDSRWAQIHLHGRSLHTF